MSQLSKGIWDIKSVLVNSETVTNGDGFDRISMDENRIAISPAGIVFDVVENNRNNLILQSQNLVYFADVEIRGSDLDLKLNRPEFTETIEINAVCGVPVEREVVQV